MEFLSLEICDPVEKEVKNPKKDSEKLKKELENIKQELDNAKQNLEKAKQFEGDKQNEIDELGKKVKEFEEKETIVKAEKINGKWDIITKN